MAAAAIMPKAAINGSYDNVVVCSAIRTVIAGKFG